MYTVWHVDKYKITFKLVINLINEILQHIVVSLGLSLPVIIDGRVQYRAMAQRLRNIDLGHVLCVWQVCTNPGHHAAQPLHFIQWHLIYLVPRYGTFCMSSFWLLNFWQNCAPITYSTSMDTTVQYVTEQTDSP